MTSSSSNFHLQEEVPARWLPHQARGTKPITSHTGSSNRSRWLTQPNCRPSRRTKARSGSLTWLRRTTSSTKQSSHRIRLTRSASTVRPITDRPRLITRSRLCRTTCLGWRWRPRQRCRSLGNLTIAMHTIWLCSRQSINSSIRERWDLLPLPRESKVGFRVKAPI